MVIMISDMIPLIMTIRVTSWRPLDGGKMGRGNLEGKAPS